MYVYYVFKRLYTNYQLVIVICEKSIRFNIFKLINVLWEDTRLVYKISIDFKYFKILYTSILYTSGVIIQFFLWSLPLILNKHLGIEQLKKIYIYIFLNLGWSCETFGRGSKIIIYLFKFLYVFIIIISIANMKNLTGGKMNIYYFKPFLN